MATIATGQYTIVNVRQSNLAYLPDPNDGTPVVANFEQGNTKERWNVNKLSNGNYTIKNVGNSAFAVAGTRAAEGSVVEGRSTAQQWVLQETRVKGQFTIASSDTRLFWGLVDNQTDTPVTLYAAATDTRNSWLFTPVAMPPASGDSGVPGTGQYTILNVRQSNLAYLPDPNDGTPVVASVAQGNTKERWALTKLSNGNFTIKNVGNNVFAVAGTRAGVGAVVEGRSNSQEWFIQETRVKGEYTIATTDSRLFWGLVDNQPNTPVSLSTAATDTRNSWIFRLVSQ